MTNINTATREEWLELRRDLLVKEKALTREREAIAKARRELPWVKIDKEYIFETDDGSKSLGDLFGARSQLVIYHFMYGPTWEAACPSCSYWADNFNGLEPHLNARDIAFMAVSRAPMSVIAPFKKRMEWDFEWVSSHPNSFNADFHVGFGEDQATPSPLMYNYREIEKSPMEEMPGISVFVKGDDGENYHTYSTFARGLEITNAAYAYMDMTPKGRDEPTEGNTMSWVRHHDKY